MNSEKWPIIESILDRALDMPPEERTSFIEIACEDDEKLKGEVTLLLESIFDSEGWLETPGDYKNEFYDYFKEDVTSPGHSFVGQTIKSFTVKKKIADGGMGTVYLGERSDEDFDQRVAIKIIRRGRATKENIQRFEREKKILASLNHPNIARLFDGGVTKAGFPFIIMEYVDGVPIDRYCTEKGSSISEIVTLFKQVLETVRYAHENLVIHRDLKPGNILVDNAGDIKILDFGISKLLENDDDLSITRTGQRLLTPRYAAPEQIKQQNISTATDTYALGVIFYTLLTGRPPFDLSELGNYDIEQLILNEEAEKPSSRVFLKDVRKEITGDLDAIALKAIRKESEQRYRVASEFLDDLRKYENGIPVSAREDSFQYRSQKFVKRHEQGMIVAFGILLLVIGFAYFYTMRITQERDLANSEARKSAQITDFLMSLFKANKPNEAKGKVVTAQMLLNEGKKRAAKLSNQPEVQARMFSIIGEVEMDYGNYLSADSLLQSAMKIESSVDNPDNKQRLSIMNDYGNLLKKQGKYNSADSTLNKVLSETNRFNLLDQKAITINDLGNIAQLQSKFSKAESLHFKALNLRKKLYGDSSKEVAASLNNIGLALHQQGNLEQAKTYLLKSLALNKKNYGNLHTETTITMRNLGSLYMDMEQMQAADSVLTKTIKADRILLGNKNPRLAEDLNELAVLKAKEGDLTAADSLFKEILSIQKATLPPNHPRIAVTLNNLAWVVKRLDKIEVAERYNREALSIAQKHFGTNNYNTAIYAHNLANVLFNLGNYKEAKPLYRQAIITLRKVLPPGHIRISDPLYDLGRLLKKTGHLNQAEKLLREALKIREDTLRENHPQVALAQAALGDCLTDLKKYEEAKVLLNKSYNTMLNLKNDKSKIIKKMLTNLNEQIEKNK